MPPDLPGFYFDAEKNRYFKIQANHVAPTGSKYSRQAVKAETVIKKDQRRVERNRRAKLATTVTRSKVLHHPLLSFDRRLGDLRRSARTGVAEYYAASLHGADALGGASASSSSSSASSSASSITPNSGRFAVDHDSGTLFGDFTWSPSPYHRSARMLALYRDRNPFFDDDDDQRYPGDDGSWRSTPHPESTGPLYSLKRGHFDTIASVARVQALVSVGRGMMAWVQSSAREGSPQESRVKVASCAASPSWSGRVDDRVNESAFYNRIVDLAVRPTAAGGGGHETTNDNIALATGSSVWLMDVSVTDPRRHDCTQYPLNQADGTNDVMKVHFLDHNVLMCGTRSGKMLLLDVREPPPASKARVGASTRIQHSSAITNMRALPDGVGPSSSHILLAGLGSTSVYDLRFTPPPCLKCHLPRANSYRQSRPLVCFDIPVPRRQSHYGLGWAYDPELNLVVAASTDYVDNHRVGVWNAGTGRMVAAASPLNEFVFSAPVTCVEVARVRDGPKSVLLSCAGVGGGVIEWSAQGGRSVDHGQTE
ncbi:hypothetical protein G647_03767 [Cladophialophora carrionii CBS 160.54]|uniref:Myocyte-specific enhancer factor 2d n=1 Tax=Cladophialophora carrionii CBS 160.54 TaxID=1279043 RepID=V9DDK9_9EURO|nr:uncharacterized protein G647_03767 [Cladophialophora carrionii CBS 160.54]ETI24398.1 hypothetical protein G647_03767 [Cladophialophora carrionii CBS 160.54]